MATSSGQSCRRRSQGHGCSKKFAFYNGAQGASKPLGSCVAYRSSENPNQHSHSGPAQGSDSNENTKPDEATTGGSLCSGPRAHMGPFSKTSIRARDLSEWTEQCKLWETAARNGAPTTTAFARMGRIFVTELRRSMGTPCGGPSYLQQRGRRGKWTNNFRHRSSVH